MRDRTGHAGVPDEEASVSGCHEERIVDVLDTFGDFLGEDGADDQTEAPVDETGEFTEQWPKGFFEERAEELQELYGEEIVTEDTTFSFDSLMIEKYGEVLSRLIEECEEIDEDDKERIIKATTKFSVAKGTIDKMKEYGDVEVVMEAVKPVVALKNIEVVKG